MYRLDTPQVQMLLPTQLQHLDKKLPLVHNGHLQPEIMC